MQVLFNQSHVLLEGDLLLFRIMCDTSNCVQLGGQALLPCSKPRLALFIAVASTAAVFGGVAAAAATLALDSSSAPRPSAPSAPSPHTPPPSPPVPPRD